MIMTVVLTVRPIHSQLSGGKTVKRYFQSFIRVTHLLLVFVLLLTFAAPVFAEGGPTSDKTDWDTVVKRYGLTPATSIPAGVTPLKFESPEQLDEFLSQLSATQKEPPHVIYRDFLGEKGSLAGASPSSTGSFVVTRSCSQNVGLSTFHTWADISVGYSGSFRWINGVLNTRTGLTGMTMGVDLHDTYSYSYNQSAVSVSVKGGGIITTYLIIDEGIQLWSSPVSCSFTYSVY